MKNVAVLVSDFSVEICQDFVQGIVDFYSTVSDVNTYIIQTQFGHESPGIFNYQYWSSLELLKSKQIDAYIIYSGVYCSLWNKNKLQELMSGFGGRLVISGAVDLEIENSYAVLNDCAPDYIEVIKHLKTLHNCKKIAFLGANSTGSPEALYRFEAFKKAMEVNNLEFDENLLFDGSFVDNKAKDAILEKLHSKEDLNFDAIVCASDLMATGCYKAFSELGVSVPDDVVVIGYDDTIHASISSPKISTISQNIVGMGAKCAESALRILNGEKLDHVIYSDLIVKYRQSCGCIGLNQNTPVYKNSAGKTVVENGLRGDFLSIYMNEILEKHKSESLIDLLKSVNTLRKLYFNLNAIVDVAMLLDMAICLYKEPLFLNKFDDNILPLSVEVAMYSTRNFQEKVFNPGIVFNPKEVLCPLDSIREEKGVYILYPIFSGEENYGYMLCKPRKSNFSAYTVNMRILAAAISSAVEYTNNQMQKEQLSTENSNLVKTNDNLSIESKTDELTKILNRRGFMEMGQRAIDVVQEINSTCIVFFADMDGLKTINDTYGHEMGDKAIKLQAEVLKSAFRNSDIVGRLSGDEFGIVANSMTLDNIATVREKIDLLNKEVSFKNNLPFMLSISMGAVDLSKFNVLTKLLIEADRDLYEEKRRKHGVK